MSAARAAGLRARSTALAALVLSAGVLASVLGAAPAPASAAAQSPSVDALAAYGGDPEAEARLVLTESERITGVQTTLTTALRAGVDLSRPFRLDTAPVATLVLTARDSPYSLDEITRLSPRTASRTGDGTIEVLEHIVITRGAAVVIAAVDADVVRLRSDAAGFVSIVSAGGSLSVRGEPDRPVRISSWDAGADAVDALTDDGRAYVRAFGGRADIINAELSGLGFWSGTTGGLSFTGTELATEGTSDAAAGQAAALSDATGAEVLPLESELDTLDFVGEEPDLGYASGVVQSVTLDGNAFGLFVTSSTQVEVRDTLIRNSLVDGIVFHRDVSSSAIINTTTSGSGRDGILIARSTSSVVLDRITANGNGRNGITLDGGSIVDGPSAIGLPVRVSGDNAVTQSTLTDNGRAGIAVTDGLDIELRGNTLARNDLGIVVSEGASRVTIIGNELTDHPRQAISVRDAGTGIIIRDNTIDGATTGIMVRESVTAIEDNRIAGVSVHGVTLIGDTGNSVVVDNRIAGAGPSPVDVIRTSGTAVRANDVSDWRSTKPLSVVLASMFQPLTILWIAIGIFVLVGLVVGRRLRAKGIHDPFADRAPLTSMTRGIVPRETVGAS